MSYYRTFMKLHNILFHCSPISDHLDILSLKFNFQSDFDDADKNSESLRKCKHPISHSKVFSIYMSKAVPAFVQ